MYVQRNVKARSCNRCCSGRAISITYSECVFADLLSTMQSITLSCPILPYLSTLSHKRCDFRKKVIEHKMRVLSFSTTFV